MIKHQTQTLPNNCVSACLAMITGLPVAEVTAAFHDPYHAHDMLPSQFLANFGIQATRHYAEEVAGLTSGCVHLVTVPSLNIQHGLHNILVVYECDADDTDKVTVFDPNKSRDGRTFYDFWPLPSWWRVELTIDLDHLVAARQAHDTTRIG